MKNSNFLSLNWLDAGKAFLVALIAFILNYLQTSFIPSLDLSPDVKLMLITGIAYVIKNFFTKPKGNQNQKIVGDRPADSAGR